MNRESRRGARSLVFRFVLIPLVGVTSPAWAGHRTGRAHRPMIVSRARPMSALNSFPAPTLGTFMPTPSLIVRGNDPVGGGYSPLGIYGEQTMSLYGPFSPLRPATAPVTTYTRGYNGEVRLTQGISSSYPNLPILSPVIYPTEANHYYGPRIVRAPWWDSAINWIDQN
jgi:hypothetical protein